MFPSLVPEHALLERAAFILAEEKKLTEITNAKGRLHKVRVLIQNLLPLQVQLNIC